MKAGIYPDMPEDDYFELPFASNSKLGVLLQRSPLHAHQTYQKADTPALVFGRMFHLMLLQPELARDTVAVKPADADKTSNANKRRLLEWMEDTAGIEADAGEGLAEGKMLTARIEQMEPEMDCFMVCAQADYDRARAMVDSVMSRSICEVIFRHGKAEVTLVAQDMESGVVCKGRADWIPHELHTLVDVKTTQNCSWDAFSRDCARYGYHRQAALYKRLYAVLTRQSEPEFLHIVVESEPPHDVGIYELDAESINAGRRDIDYALETWARCQDEGIFPGTGWSWTDREYRIQPLTLPSWAL